MCCLSRASSVQGKRGRNTSSRGRWINRQASSTTKVQTKSPVTAFLLFFLPEASQPLSMEFRHIFPLRSLAFWQMLLLLLLLGESSCYHAHGHTCPSLLLLLLLPCNIAQVGGKHAQNMEDHRADLWRGKSFPSFFSWAAFCQLPILRRIHHWSVSKFRLKSFLSATVRVSEKEKTGDPTRSRKRGNLISPPFAAAAAK